VGSGGFVLVEGWYGFKVFCFKYLVAFQAPDIVDPVAPGKYFGARMLTIRHIVKEYPLF
jgi:hypothetical protein